MRLIVISDTHIPQAAAELPRIIANEIQGSDICLHLGDFTEKKVFDCLKQKIKLYAVAGNMDDAALTEILPKKRIIKLENITIGLIHGKGRAQNPIEAVNNSFSADYDKIDIFIFGHSHSPINQSIGGKFYFNPGSPTDKIFASYNSYGILELNRCKIKRRIVKFG